MTYTLLAETTPVARKRHRCIWCGEHIEIGARYTHEKSVYDGEMQDHKWHDECRAAACEGWANGDDAEFQAYAYERPEKIEQVTP